MIHFSSTRSVQRLTDTLWLREMASSFVTVTQVSDRIGGSRLARTWEARRERNVSLHNSVGKLFLVVQQLATDWQWYFSPPVDVLIDSKMATAQLLYTEPFSLRVSADGWFLTAIWALCHFSLLFLSGCR